MASDKSNAGVVSEPPNATETPPKLMLEFDNLELAIEPANCVFVIPPAFTVTAPELTPKSSLENDATPLFEVVASSPAIVIVSSETVVSIPSPPVNDSVPPVVKVSFVPLSAESVNDVFIDVEPPNETAEPFIFIDEFVNAELGMFV